jgi:hypothetical protein
MVARKAVTRYASGSPPGAENDTRESFDSVNAVMLYMDKPIGSAGLLRVAIQKNRPLYGYYWQYAVANDRFSLSQHVTCPRRTKVLMLLYHCTSIEELATHVQEHLPQAAQSRSRARMKLKWNPAPDGDCFFSALFFACFMIVAYTELDEITLQDIGVCQIFGSKQMRHLFLTYFKNKKEKLVCRLFPHLQSASNAPLGNQ